jgi:hypothetical protein
MYTKLEFRNLASSVPDNFEEKTSEFWSYVHERLNRLSGKMNRIYRDGICKSGGEALSRLRSIDSENYLAVKDLVEKGAHLVATEDPILVGESESWAVMLKNSPLDIGIRELLQENLAERTKYISNTIEQTLKHNETGVFFLLPSLNVELSKDIEIIRMWRFDPSDYLKSWQAKLRLRSSIEKDEDAN